MTADRKPEDWTPRQRRAFWRKVYRTLTPCQQRVVTGCVLQGRRPAQVARELGVHRSTVGRTLRRALDRLREALDSEI